MISGAGPTVLAFAEPGLDPLITAALPTDWSMHRVGVGTHGARVVPLTPLD